jgi:DNA polymerase III epsilon subunit-like protein
MSGSSGDLINFPIKKLVMWRAVLSAYMAKYGSLYAVSDTETTGLSIVDAKGDINRVLEWSICFAYKDSNGLLRHCVDEDGEQINLDEPMNPFFFQGSFVQRSRLTINYVPKESTVVHGMTLEYLCGEGEGEYGRGRLKGSAPSFELVWNTLLSLLDFDDYKKHGKVIYMVFHKASFDVSFLNSECQMWNMPPIESYFSIIDTLKQKQDIIHKSILKQNSLDAIYQYGLTRFKDEIGIIERPLHSSLIDSRILVMVYNVLVLHLASPEATTIITPTNEVDPEQPLL